MNTQEAQLFHFYMALILLKKGKEAIKKCDEKKLKEISQYGKLYSYLCLIT